MQVNVCFFAALRELAGCGRMQVEVAEGACVGDVWRQVGSGLDWSQPVLAACNQQHVEFDAPVQAGDEVAFFPTVTGG